MTCQELSAFYDLFALDMAEEQERAELEAHLRRGCENCTPGVARALERAALLGLNAPAEEPSPELRDRILASVGVRPKRQVRPLWIWAAGLVAAALAAIAIYLAIQNHGYSEEFVRLRDQIHTAQDQSAAQASRDAAQRSELARLREAFAIVLGPNTVEATFGGTQPKPPHGKVFVNPRRGVVFIASDLPPAALHRIYEMWLIPKGGKPIPAGVFQSQNDGQALHIHTGEVDVASTAAVAVTEENAGGANQPTSKPFIVAPVPAH